MVYIETSSITTRLNRTNLESWIPALLESNSQVSDDNISVTQVMPPTSAIPEFESSSERGEQSVISIETASDISPWTIIHQQNISTDQDCRSSVSRRSHQLNHINSSISDINEYDLPTLDQYEIEHEDYELEESDDDELHLSTEEYTHALEMAQPIRIPNAISEESETEPIRSFDDDFAEAMNAIRDIQSQIHDIRQMYNNIIDVESEQLSEIIEDEYQLPTYDEYLNEDQDISNFLYQPYDPDNEDDEDDDEYNELFDRHHQNQNEDLEDSEEMLYQEPENNDPLNELSFQNMSLLDEDDLEVIRAANSQMENQEPNFAIWSHRARQTQSAQQFTQNQRIHRYAKFYLDSNGNPNVKYEPFEHQRFQSANNGLRIKMTPIGILDLNGDLDCVVGAESTYSDDLEEIKVIIKSNEHTKDKNVSINFRHNKTTTWKDNDEMCIGR